MWIWSTNAGRNPAAVLPVTPSSPTSKPGLADHTPEAVEAHPQLGVTAEMGGSVVIERESRTPRLWSSRRSGLARPAVRRGRERAALRTRHAARRPERIAAGCTRGPRAASVRYVPP